MKQKNQTVDEILQNQCSIIQLENGGVSILNDALKAKQALKQAVINIKSLKNIKCEKNGYNDLRAEIKAEIEEVFK